MNSIFKFAFIMDRIHIEILKDFPKFKVFLSKKQQLYFMLKIANIFRNTQQLAFQSGFFNRNLVILKLWSSEHLSQLHLYTYLALWTVPQMSLFTDITTFIQVFISIWIVKAEYFLLVGEI